MIPDPELPIAPLLPPAAVHARIRDAVRAEARRARIRVAEGVLHAGFALGALAWAVAAVAA